MALSMTPVIRLMRPVQWVKNFFVVIPLVLSQQVTSIDAIKLSALTFGIFCLITSAVYVWNDIIDRHNDREHPEKSKRPVASRAISIRHATILTIILAIAGLLSAYALNVLLFKTAILYFVLNFFYTLILKHIAIIELFALAGNYVLRIVGGTVVIGELVTPWNIILATLLALFLALGKRRTEYVRLKLSAMTQRRVLRYYNEKLLDGLMVGTALATIIAWLLYTMEPSIQARLQTTLLPLSTIFVVYGISRYFYLVKEKNRGESPALTFLTDPPLIISVGLWMTFIVSFRLFT